MIVGLELLDRLDNFPHWSSHKPHFNYMDFFQSTKKKSSHVIALI